MNKRTLGQRLRGFIFGPFLHLYNRLIGQPDVRGSQWKKF